MALVTGGSRGIGKAITLALAAAGAAVAVNYRERVSNANAVVGQIRDHNGRAEAFSCDVSVGASVHAMVQTIEECLGPIDILVNNAGIAASHGDETTEEDFDRTIAINLKSAFLCTEAVLPGMRERHWGRIINLSAMGARAGSRSVAYGAAKAGLEGLTRSYALQLAKEGVTVNAVAPGLIDTEMTRELVDSGSAIARVPAARAGTADEIAQAVMLVVTNGYITGQTAPSRAAHRSPETDDHKFTPNTFLRTSRYLDSLTTQNAVGMNRLHAAEGSKSTHRCVIQDLKRSLVSTELRIRRLRREAMVLIREDEELHQRYRLLTSIPGIAQISAIQLLGELCTLSQDMTVREWVAHSGLDPVHEISGTSVKKQ